MISEIKSDFNLKNAIFGFVQFGFYHKLLNMFRKFEKIIFPVDITPFTLRTIDLRFLAISKWAEIWFSTRFQAPD